MWIQGHLRPAPMVITLTTRTHARPTVTMDLAGSRAESLLAWGRGDGVGTASMGDLAMAGEATMEAGGPFRGAADLAAGSVMVTPVEEDVLTAEVAGASMEDAVSVEAVVPTAEVDGASVGVAAASVEVDVASVEGDMEAGVVMVVGAVMVVGTGRFRPKSRLSRPTASAVGRCVDDGVAPTAVSLTILAP